tara:strand:- start:329 stop:1432 length:1104 start_codon:yes stop_codon:yes gene_type:complete
MIPFLSFDYQNNIIREDLISSIKKIIDSNLYVLGQNVLDFEKKYSELSDVKYAIGVGSGLDALTIALKALNIKSSDEVIVASNSYIACWLSISNVGANIVPVEPDSDTFNINPNLIEEKISSRTKVIMPVHLYGQPCEMDKIMALSKKYGLFVVEDNAQSHLAKYNSNYTGSFGDINATSFYPTKNLGAIGEAGCITTNNKNLRDYVKAYRNYGSNKKYFNIIKGSNSRIDEIQASILNVKLKYLIKWNEQRKILASIYDSLLKDIQEISTPVVMENSEHVYHLYVIKTSERDKLQKFLNNNQIATSIHYPIPPHLQDAYKDLGYKKGDFPIAEKLAETSLSLPLYPGLKEEQIEFICEKISKFFSR